MGLLYNNRISVVLEAIARSLEVLVRARPPDDGVRPTIPPMPHDETLLNLTRLRSAASLTGNAESYFNGLANHHRCPSGSLAPYSRCP
jgi:hypothetical protein